MITLLLVPERDLCEICDRPTELKNYAPRFPVCLACALSDKGQGHRQAQDEDETK